MELIPTKRDVIDLLRTTGALRDGHFACPSGLHTSQFLETALAMRYYSNAKVLSVGLSRLVRANHELRAMIRDLSLVAATPAGLPVAYGLCEALRANQVYWLDRPSSAEPMRFLPFLEPSRGEKVLLVDDILRDGIILEEVRRLLEARGAQVVGLAVLVHQPTPLTHDFGALPIYSLTRLESCTYAEPAECGLCRQGVALETIRREPLEQILQAHAAVV